VFLPVCGDGIWHTGEECDDHNTTSGDGCSDICWSEPPWEYEPNNTLAEANTFWPGVSHWYGSIKPKGEHDWYVFNYATPGQSLTIGTSDVGNVIACSASTDTKITLFSSAGMEIASDDDAGPGTCSLLSSSANGPLMNLAPDTYYVRVQHYGDTAEIPGYQLTVTIQ
jgi:cysteine-rich repeat protein